MDDPQWTTVLDLLFDDYRHREVSRLTSAVARSSLVRRHRTAVGVCPQLNYRPWIAIHGRPSLETFARASAIGRMSLYSRQWTAVRERSSVEGRLRFR